MIMINHFSRSLVTLTNKILYFPDAADEELAGHCLSLFIDGFETSSQVMSFVLYELARHADIQDRVSNEVNEVLARHDSQITYEAMQEMWCLDCVVQGSSYSFNKLHL